MRQLAFALTAMNKSHIAALICFALALLWYAVGSSHQGAGGFLFLGFIFELLGWKKISDSAKDEKK
jgi:hypothetical protein